MKKHLIIFSLIFSMFAAFSQEVQPTDSTPATDTTTKQGTTFCPHRINVYLGGSFSGSIFDKVNNDFIKRNYAFGSILEVKYAYFFTEHWGLGLGVGISNFSSKGTYKMNEGGVIRNYEDPAFDALIDPDREYDLIYHVNGLVEKQSMWAIEVPLMAQFEHKFGGKNGIYAQLGVKGYFPFTAKSRFPGKVEIETRGFEGFVDNHDIYQYHELPGRFGTGYVKPEYKSDKVNKMRCSIDIQAEFGGIFQLTKTLDLYVGLYGSYGFLNILPKAEKQIEFIVPPITPKPDNADITAYYNLPSSLASDILVDYNNYIKDNNKDWKETKNKWNLWQVGLKVGFHIKACNNGDPDEPTMRELKRKYYEEMAKKANDPIIIKNTEYIYIVPTCPEGYQEDEDLTQEDKDNIKKLAEALSNTKILFDLDKDIPKYTDQNDNMRKVAEIMKKDNTLSLVIEGYTCDLGSETHNQDLAQRRAIAVKSDFVNKFGVNADQISIAAYTAKTPENINNIPDKSREEHRAAIFRIVKN